MAPRLILTAMAVAVLLGAGGVSRASDGSIATEQCAPEEQGCFALESTIAFSSTRDHLGLTPVANAAEIYLMNPDGTNPRRLTDNLAGDGFAALSPDGKKIVFDSTRLSGQTNVSDLFLMNTDGSGQTFLTRGSSATWSPDGKSIAYHASASGTGTPTRTNPGAATTDSDIFVANVDDLLAGTAQPVDITNTPDKIEDDADWSSDGRILYTAHDVGDDVPNGPGGFTSNSAEIYVINADGSGRVQVTNNNEEERAAAWSPDGTRIVDGCRIGGGTNDFEICVMNADGTDVQQLTDNTLTDLTATFSPDGQQIVFNKILPPGNYQLFEMQPSLNPDGTRPAPTQVTSPPGINLIANWGQLRVHLKQ